MYKKSSTRDHYGTQRTYTHARRETTWSVGIVKPHHSTRYTGVRGVIHVCMFVCIQYFGDRRWSALHLMERTDSVHTVPSPAVHGTVRYDTVWYGTARSGVCRDRFECDSGDGHCAGCHDFSQGLSLTSTRFVYPCMTFLYTRVCFGQIRGEESK